MYKMFQECSQKRRRQRGVVKDKILCRLICSSTVNAFMCLVPFLSLLLKSKRLPGETEL